MKMKTIDEEDNDGDDVDDVVVDDDDDDDDDDYVTSPLSTVSIFSCHNQAWSCHKSR
jgi:hypothetical protein